MTVVYRNISSNSIRTVSGGVHSQGIEGEDLAAGKYESYMHLQADSQPHIFCHAILDDYFHATC